MNTLSRINSYASIMVGAISAILISTVVFSSPAVWIPFGALALLATASIYQRTYAVHVCWNTDQRNLSHLPEELQPSDYPAPKMNFPRVLGAATGILAALWAFDIISFPQIMLGAALALSLGGAFSAGYFDAAHNASLTSDRIPLLTLDAYQAMGADPSHYPHYVMDHIFHAMIIAGFVDSMNELAQSFAVERKGIIKRVTSIFAWFYPSAKATIGCKQPKPSPLFGF